MEYVAPVSDIRFVLKTMAGLDDLIADGLAGDLDDDLLSALLEEAGKAAQGLLAPLNVSGDRAGAKLTDQGVTAAPGFAAAYEAWRQGGWSGVDASPDFGGMGLPTSVGAAVMELWNGANMAFALCPVLTQGAAEAIAAHASDDLKALYLARLVSGEWTAAMALTESSAGSDLSNLRTRAEPAGDGTYRLFGSKIFITYGDHDMAPNIVHLVLARLPGARRGRAASRCSWRPSSFRMPPETWARATISAAPGWSTSWASTPAQPAQCPTATAQARRPGWSGARTRAWPACSP